MRAPLLLFLGLATCQSDSRAPAADLPTGDGSRADADTAGAPGVEDAAPDEPAALEPVGALRRFDLINPMCTAELLDSGGACPSDDTKCLCRPEFDALNPAVGAPGNPEGRVLVLSQPRWGKRDDGSYVFDAYQAIKDQGNTVGYYVNELNPARACTAAASWSGVGCAGDAGCGWRCVTGADHADALVDAEIAAFGGYPAPEAVMLNEAWSLVYRDDAAGIAYRTWLRDLTRRMAARGRLPMLFLQEHKTPSGPFTLLSEIAQHGVILVEAYVSGRQVLAAPGRCAPPYDATNFCYQEYRDVRNAVRNSAQPPIPYDRLILIEHFASNTYRTTDPQGNPRLNAWGRAYDDDPGSATFGTPNTATWRTIIERRARAMKALPSLGGAGSYLWPGNGSGTGSSYRIGFEEAYSGIELP